MAEVAAEIRVFEDGGEGIHCRVEVGGDEVDATVEGRLELGDAAGGDGGDEVVLRTLD